MYSWLVVNALYLRRRTASCTAADFEIGTETFEKDVVVNGVECGRNVQ